MNKNKSYLMLTFLNIIFLLTFISLSFARYKSNLSGEYKGKVLKWHFELVDGIQETQEIDLPITRTDSNSNVPLGKIAR